MRGIFVHIKTDPKDFVNIPLDNSKIIQPNNIGAIFSYTNDELLKKLLDFYHKNGRPPTRKEYRNGRLNNLPSHHTYTKRFGGIIQACRLAGISIKKYTKEEALK